MATLEQFGEAMKADDLMRVLTFLWRALLINVIRFGAFAGRDGVLILLLLLLAVLTIFYGGPTTTATPIPF